MGNFLSRNRSRNQYIASPSQSRPALSQSGNTGSPRTQQGCYGPSSHPSKKALLIGIRYKKGRWPDPRLKESMDLKEVTHRETQSWHDMLQRFYDYREEDIICMQDISQNKKTNRWPSRENILAQLRDLVHDVRPGDRRFLFIAAHGGQHPCTSDQTELDGKDEIMYTLEENKRNCLVIKDNELRHILVDNLPAGAYLTVVLELCNSGTLMDLPFQLDSSNPESPTLAPAKRNAEDLQGNILCLSACEDAQQARHFRTSSKEQGILTSIIQGTLAAAQSQGPPNLQVIGLHRVLVDTCHELSQNGATQTPMVTVGRSLTTNELTGLVFRP